MDPFVALNKALLNFVKDRPTPDFSQPLSVIPVHRKRLVYTKEQFSIFPINHEKQLETFSVNGDPVERRNVSRLQPVGI